RHAAAVYEFPRLTNKKFPALSIHSRSDCSMIESDKLSKKVHTSVGELLVLDEVSLRVSDGDSLAIVGASGSGKSTLLGILAGLDVPTGGTVRLNGLELTAMNEEGRAKVRADNVGFVFQSFQLLPGLSALENV